MSPMNCAKIARILEWISAFWNVNTLTAEIHPALKVSLAIFFCQTIQRRKESVILRHVLIHDRGLKIGELQITHFMPLHHMGVEVNVQLANKQLDVADRSLRVPTAVNMNCQDAQIKIEAEYMRDI